MVRVDRKKEASAGQAVARRALENARTELQLEGLDDRRRRVKPTSDGRTPEQAPPQKGAVDPRLRPFGQPRDWVDAAVRVITAAKLASVSEKETASRKRSDGRRGGRRGEAQSGMLRRRIGLLGFEVPEWLSEAMLERLVRMTALESGSRGQFSQQRLEELLRDPPKLRRQLGVRVRRPKVARSNARSAPRKRPSKKRKQA